MEVDIPRLRKVVEWVEEEAAKDRITQITGPKQGETVWMQATWIGKWDCGTACCVAGKVALDAGAVPVGTCGPMVSYQGDNYHVSDLARRLLGLTGSQAHSLFLAHNTAEDIRAVAEEIAGERL